jgi:hypothetical protein
MKDLKDMFRTEIESNETLHNSIINFLSTNNIDINWKDNYKQAVFHFLYGVKSKPICHCGNPLKFKSFNLGYRKNCSFRCAGLSSDRLSKMKQTKLEKYGDENFNNMNKNKRTKLEKYGDENYNNRDSAKETSIKKYGTNHHNQNEDIKEKIKQTKKVRYGSSSYNNIEKIKDTYSNYDFYEAIIKNKKTKLEKYGDENYNNKDKMINTKVDLGLYVDVTKKMNWEQYRNYVRRLTNKYRKELFEDWDGFDYYDGEYIKENFKFKHYEDKFPTIDHKISIFHGFTNDIAPEIISDINNLCITKKGLNSKKNIKINFNFNLS